MLLGAHQSIAGGLHNSFQSGLADGCEVIQIFTKNSNQWFAKPLTAENIALFKSAWQASEMGPVTAHDTYLINLASPDPQKHAQSLEAYTNELKRCDQLGIHCLVMHPGSHMKQGEESGLKKIADSLVQIYKDNPALNTLTLLETTAGQGSNLGYRFEQLRFIMDLAREIEKKLGVCFDTAHTFAAGYDLRTAQSFYKVLEEFDATVGIDKLKAFHLNDSKKELGSRVDRHDHIGKGFIGLEAFRFLVNEARFAKIPGYIETPADFKQNLEILKGLRENE